MWMTGTNAMTGGGERTSRQHGGAADRYRGPSYDAYNDDAARPYPGHQQQQQQQAPPQLWYPTNRPESPPSSSSSSSSAAAVSAGSRRVLHDLQRQRPTPYRAGHQREDDGVRFFVAFTFVVDLCVLVGLALLEYFLRSVLALSTTNIMLYSVHWATSVVFIAWKKIIPLQGKSN